MKYTDFVTYVRNKTRTNSTTFSDADLVVYANLAKDEIAKKITDMNDHYFGTVMEHDVVADQRRYTFESDVLNNIYYVEGNIKTDSSTNGWTKLQYYDMHSLNIPTNESDLKLYMADYAHGYFIFGNEFWLLTDCDILAATKGLKVWTYVYPQDIETGDLVKTTDMSVPDSTIEHALPRQFHELLARRVIIMYKEAQDKPIPLTERESAFEFDLGNTLTDMTGLNLDGSVIATSPFNDGSQY